MRLGLQDPAVGDGGGDAEDDGRVDGLHAGLLDGEARQIVAAVVVDGQANAVGGAAVIPVDDVALEDGGAAAAEAVGEVAEADLEVVQVVDVGELGGDGGADEDEDEVEDGGVRDDDGEVLFAEDLEGVDGVGEADLAARGLVSGRGVAARADVVGQGHVPFGGRDGAVPDHFPAGLGHGEDEGDEPGDAEDEAVPEDGPPPQVFG